MKLGRNLIVHPLNLLFAFFHFIFIIHLYFSGAPCFIFWGLTLLPFYLLLDWKKVQLNFGDFGIHFVWMTYGFYGTFLLQYFFSPMLSAPLVALLFAFSPFLSHSYRNRYSPIVYAGCFAGMAVNQYLPQLVMGLLVTLPGTLIYLVSRDSLEGIGGKLGTIGFAALILVCLWYWI